MNVSFSFPSQFGVYRGLTAPGHAGLFYMQTMNLISLAPCQSDHAPSSSLFCSSCLSLSPCGPLRDANIFFHLETSQNISLHLWQIHSASIPACFIYTSPRVWTLMWENKQKGLNIWSVAEGHLCFRAIKRLGYFDSWPAFTCSRASPPGSRQMHRWKKGKLKRFVF